MFNICKRAQVTCFAVVVAGVIVAHRGARWRGLRPGCRRRFRGAGALATPNLYCGLFMLAFALAMLWVSV